MKWMRYPIIVILRGFPFLVGKFVIDHILGVTYISQHHKMAFAILIIHLRWVIHARGHWVSVRLLNTRLITPLTSLAHRAFHTDQLNGNPAASCRNPSDQ